MEGIIDLTSGSISMSNNGSEKKIEFYENGFVELSVNGFSAHMEFDTTVQRTATLTSYNASFPSIDIPAFAVCCLICGLVFSADVHFLDSWYRQRWRSTEAGSLGGHRTGYQLGLFIWVRCTSKYRGNLPTHGTGILWTQ